MLAEQPVNPAFAGEATGFNAGEQGEGEQPKADEADKRFATIRMMVDAGKVSASQAEKFIALRKKGGSRHIAVLSAAMKAGG